MSSLLNLKLLPGGKRLNCGWYGAAQLFDGEKVLNTFRCGLKLGS